jgi:hypothetical protein
MSAGTNTSINGNKLNDPNSLCYCDMFGSLFQDLGKISSPPWKNEFKILRIASYPLGSDRRRLFL